MEMYLVVFLSLFLRTYATCSSASNASVNLKGFHGDAILSWDSDSAGNSVLQAALDCCNANNGVGGVLENCPPFVPFLDSRGANACTPENPLVNEDIGDGHDISALPGNNPVTIKGRTYVSTVSRLCPFEGFV